MTFFLNLDPKSAAGNSVSPGLKGREKSPKKADDKI